MTEIEIEEEKKALTREYKELLRISYQALSAEDKKIIRKAFDVAVDAHKDQRRKSGEAYIFHPIGVKFLLDHHFFWNEKYWRGLSWNHRPVDYDRSHDARLYENSKASRLDDGALFGMGQFRNTVERQSLVVELTKAYRIDLRQGAWNQLPAIALVFTHPHIASGRPHRKTIPRTVNR